jgi:hypothetical protein
MVDFCGPGMEQLSAPEHVAFLENLVIPSLAAVADGGAARTLTRDP